MRLTIIDGDGSVSMVGPAYGAKVFTAACSRRPTSLEALIAAAAPYDRDLTTYLLDGLAAFDEHNAAENCAAIHARLQGAQPADSPPFRVVDEVTRAASLAPVEAGLVIYNLPAQRIVQVQNSYSTILRRDRGRVRASGQPTRKLYHYDLPHDWSIVP